MNSKKNRSWISKLEPVMLKHKAADIFNLKKDEISSALSCNNTKKLTDADFLLLKLFIKWCIPDAIFVTR